MLSFQGTQSTSWRRSITGNSPINFQHWWRPKEWLQLSGFFEIYSNYFIVCILFIFRKCVSKVLAERSGNSSLGTLVNKILVRSDVRPKLEKLEVSLHSSETLEVINSFRTPLFIPISQMEQVGFLVRLTSKHWFQVQIEDESDGEGHQAEKSHEQTNLWVWPVQRVLFWRKSQCMLDTSATKADLSPQHSSPQPWQILVSFPHFST